MCWLCCSNTDIVSDEVKKENYKKYNISEVEYNTLRNSGLTERDIRNFYKINGSLKDIKKTKVI